MNPRVVAVAVLISVTACGRKGTQGEERAVPGSTVSVVLPPSATPGDHLAPDELAEGSDCAFGVVLPRALRVTRSFPDVVSASGPVAMHTLVRYFVAHLDGGGLREGAEAATFEHVRPHGKGDPELLVRVTSAYDGANVEIQKVTHPPAPNLPDEASRWRQVGLTPNGKIVDPSHLE